MSKSEDELKEEYKEAGVELDELQESEETPDDENKEPQDDSPEPTGDTEKDESEGDEPEDEEDQAPLQDEPRKKRSIYDDYKSKKQELREEQERAERLERENAQLQEKLQALDDAGTPAERQKAQDDIDAFAKEIGADASALAKLRDIILKDAKSGLSEEDRKAIEELREFQKQSAQAIEKQRFEEEFKQTLPELKNLFPEADDKELSSLKDELDKISHTEEYHDKSLDYVAFKNREKLNALISPKKRGMESRGKKEPTQIKDDFDPNADLASMTPKQRDQWEEQYREATKSDELVTDSEGRKLII